VTTTAFRLVAAAWAARAFDGAGARRYGGRWNPVGLPAVYVSAYRSLALLEVLVNLERPGPVADYVFLPVRFADRLVERLDRRRLPVAWRRAEPPAELMMLGGEWLAARRSAVLEVPSAVVPAESNFLLNPLHPEFGAIELGDAEPFELDPRLHEA
jgi:RES domain-containing protein